MQIPTTLLSYLKKITKRLRQNIYYEFLRSFPEAANIEKKAKKHFKNSSKLKKNFYTPRNAIELKTQGFTKINGLKAGIKKQARINFCDFKNENAFSKSWDPVSNIQETVKGLNYGDNYHRHIFKITNDLFIELKPFLENIALMLSDIHKMSFDFVDYSAVRTLKSNFEESFTNYLWHIDFMRRSNFEYKVMLLLNNVEKENGPMQLTDLRFNRTFMLKKNYRMSEKFVRRKSKKFFICKGNKFDTFIFGTNNAHKAGKVFSGCREVMIFTFYPGSGNIKLPNKNFNESKYKMKPIIESGFEK